MRYTKAFLTMAALAAGSGCQPSAPSLSGSKVIYGTDNRKELDDSSNAPGMVTAAQSTAVLVHRSDLAATDSSSLALPKATFKDVMGVCDSEPYATEPSAGFCSGFLVGPDIFVTAGHCITSVDDCSSTAMVFDYEYDTAQSDPTSVKPDNVYYCKDIINRQEVETGADYAVVHLDRAVAGRAPLPFRADGKIEDDAQLTMIGYPSGLPLKIDAGKHVRDNTSDGFFVGNTDSYGGNSGSAVFNSATGVVEGVLVRGEQDFVDNNGCQVSKVCGDNECRGEDSTRATAFAPFVKAALASH